MSYTRKEKKKKKKRTAIESYQNKCLVQIIKSQIIAPRVVKSNRIKKKAKQNSVAYSQLIPIKIGFLKNF